MRTWLRSGAVALACVLTGCTGSAGPTAESPAPDGGRPTSHRSSHPTAPPAATATAPPTTATTRPTTATTPPPSFDTEAALATVRLLAGRIGPREATSPAYGRAAGHVSAALRDLGYRVRRQQLAVPAGVSWGVPVPAGETWNVVATPPTFEPGAPYRIVGAHLDTVPQAPGAEDNASGVAVLLELARLASTAPPKLPVLFVAFGAEEPRGETDDDHHYGSRAYVARMTAEARRSLRGMVSLDRVGVGEVVPICTASGPLALHRAVTRAARRAGVPAIACDNRSSDHWSFVRDGLPGVRVGGTSYAAYHSADDLPGVVEPAQLRRTGRLVWEWLSPAP